MKNSLRIHKWTHNEFNIFILGVLTHPLSLLLFLHKGSCFHPFVNPIAFVSTLSDF